MMVETLGGRISLGYAFMAALLGIAVTATLYQADNVARTSDRIRELREPTSRNCLRMLNAINESNSALRGWTILSDPSLKERRGKLWSEQIYPDYETMLRLSKDWTDTTDKTRLNDIAARLDKLDRFQQRIVDIAHTPENNLAQKLFAEEAIPHIQTINGAIAEIMAIESVQESTGDRKRLLGLVGQLGRTTGLVSGDIRAYLLTGDAATRTSFDENWRHNSTQLANVQSRRDLLTLEQRQNFAQLQMAHHKLGPLLSQVIEIRSGAQWNQAAYLLATKAIPVTLQIQRLLETIADNQRQLMASDLEDNKHQVAGLRLIEWGLLVIGLSACSILAFAVSRSVIRPITHAVDVATSIASGHFDCDTNIGGSAEARSLGAALSTMSESLVVAEQTNQRQIWLRTGQQTLADAVCGNSDVMTISRIILRHLAKYLDCQVGVFYVVNKGQVLSNADSFGLSQRLKERGDLEFGEGLAGQAALDRQQIVLTELTKDYLNVNVDLGESVPTNIVVTPILYNGDVKAVIQLGSFSQFTDQQFELLDLVAETIAIAIESAHIREQSRNQGKRLEAIVNTAADPIITITGVGKVQSFNPAAERLFGFSEKEMLGKNIKRLMPSPYQEQHDEYLSRYLAGDDSTIIGTSREALARKRDGTEFPILLSVSRVITEDTDSNGDNGSTCLFTGIIRDLTEQKQLEAALLSAKAGAEAANVAKSEFLANMSHEIRTPMTAILGFSDILMNEEGIERAPPQRRESIATIHRNGKYLIEIINDILDLSKIEAGKMEVERIECSPFPILQDVVSLVQVPANSKGLLIEIENNGPLPQTIQSDPTRLRQILINLVGNAIKFTETGKIRLVARLLNADAASPALQIDVIDTGIGLTEEQMDKLFQPFVQADSSTTRKFGGTGLGLTISKRLAEALGGGIDVHSALGKGSTFTVTLSTGSLEGVAMVNSPAEVDVLSNHAVKKVGVRLDCRVLLAEDGPDNQRLISFILEKAGAEVTIADNGRIACNLALTADDEGDPFDIILMDMQMPVMDGYTATGKLREAGYTRPIVALTAHAMSSDRDKCLGAGCDDHTTKPIDREKLISIVAQYTLLNSYQGQ